MRLSRRARYSYLRFIRLKGDPQALARATAIGVFVGITPTMPLHTLIILLVTLVSRTSTLASLFVSVLVCNPFTFVPLYFLAVVLGNVITPYELDWQRVELLVGALRAQTTFSGSVHEVLALGHEALIVLLSGGLLLALPLSIASYYISLRIFKKIRHRKSNMPEHRQPLPSSPP